MRKRSNYRPKKNLRNPLGFVLEGLAPVSKHEEYLNIKLKNEVAFNALKENKASNHDVTIIANAHNFVDSLMRIGFGVEYKDVLEQGKKAILALALRAQTRHNFDPTPEEIFALEQLLELNDAQMDTVTVGDVYRAQKLEASSRLIEIKLLSSAVNATIAS